MTARGRQRARARSALSSPLSSSHQNVCFACSSPPSPADASVPSRLFARGRGADDLKRAIISAAVEGERPRRRHRAWQQTSPYAPRGAPDCLCPPRSPPSAPHVLSLARARCRRTRTTRGPAPAPNGGVRARRRAHRLPRAPPSPPRRGAAPPRAGPRPAPRARASNPNSEFAAQFKRRVPPPGERARPASIDAGINERLLGF